MALGVRCSAFVRGQRSGHQRLAVYPVNEAEDALVIDELDMDAHISLHAAFISQDVILISYFIWTTNPKVRGSIPLGRAFNINKLQASLDTTYECALRASTCPLVY
jgi:hypothetical protein